MPILDKPFLRGLKITRRIFGYEPKVFNSFDLNQALDGQYDATMRLNEEVGMLRENWKVNIKLQDDFVVGGINGFTTQITITKTNTASPAYVYAKGVRFEIPTGDQVQYNGTFQLAAPGLPIVYVVLIATKKIITYADNPSLCGLTSTEYPYSLPSSDVEQYSKERLELTDNPTGVTLGTNEEIIGIIATITAADNGTLSRPNTTVNYSFQPGFIRVTRYNAVLLSEMLDSLNFQRNDELLNGLAIPGYTAVVAQTEKGNSSLADVVLKLIEYIKRKLRYLDLIKTDQQAKIDALTARITAIDAALLAIGGNITALGGLTQVPVGVWFPYDGPLTDFEADGRGKVGTQMANFRICNGKQGAPNPAGRFVVGAIAGVVGLETSTLKPEVNPSNNTLPPGANPNYSHGDMGGEAVHQLTKAEMAKHSHGTPGSVSINGVNDNKYGMGSDTDVPNVRTQEEGEDKPHNNLPPFLATYFIQRYK